MASAEGTRPVSDEVKTVNKEQPIGSDLKRAMAPPREMVSAKQSAEISTILARADLEEDESIMLALQAILPNHLSVDDLTALMEEAKLMDEPPTEIFLRAVDPHDMLRETIAGQKAGKTVRKIDCVVIACPNKVEVRLTPRLRRTPHMKDFACALHRPSIGV